MTQPPASSDNSALRAEFDRRKSRIRAMKDRPQALREAAKLGREMAAFRSEAAQLRSEIARELHDSGESLSGIAAIIEVSRATVQNVLGKKPARRKRDGA